MTYDIDRRDYQRWLASTAQEDIEPEVCEECGEEIYGKRTIDIGGGFLCEDCGYN